MSAELVVGNVVDMMAAPLLGVRSHYKSQLGRVNGRKVKEEKVKAIKSKSCSEREVTVVRLKQLRPSTFP